MRSEERTSFHTQMIKSVLFLFVFNSFCLSLELVFKFFELGSESFENFVFRIFFENMVEQANAYNKLFSVFFGDVADCNCFFNEFGKVMMSTEVKVENFLDFVINHLSKIEMVAVFCLFHNACFKCF